MSRFDLVSDLEAAVDIPDARV